MANNVFRFSPEWKRNMLRWKSNNLSPCVSLLSQGGLALGREEGCAYACVFVCLCVDVGGWHLPPSSIRSTHPPSCSSQGQVTGTAHSLTHSHCWEQSSKEHTHVHASLLPRIPVRPKQHGRLRAVRMEKRVCVIQTDFHQYRAKVGLHSRPLAHVRNLLLVVWQLVF